MASEEEEVEEVEPSPPDYQWSVWARVSDEDTKGDRVVPKQQGFVTSQEDFEHCAAQMWGPKQLRAMQTHEQLRIIKLKPLAEGQKIEARYDWAQQGLKSQRGWCFRVCDFKPFGPSIRPRSERVGAFKSINRNQPHENLETAFCDAFTALCHGAITGELRPWDDCNLIDAIVFHKIRLGAYVEVWLPTVGVPEPNPNEPEPEPAAEGEAGEGEAAPAEEAKPKGPPAPIPTDKPIRDQMLRSIQRCLKKYANLTKDEYEIHLSKSDKYFGHKFDSDHGTWKNQLKMDDNKYG